MKRLGLVTLIVLVQAFIQTAPRAQAQRGTQGNAGALVRGALTFSLFWPTISERRLHRFIPACTKPVFRAVTARSRLQR